MKTLMQILQETKVADRLLPSDTDRRLKLRQITHNQAYLPPEVVEQENWRHKMLAAGFAWVVRPKFVERFRYAAGVYAWSDNFSCMQVRFVVSSRYSYADGSRDPLVYAGDIPDFALERIEQAKNLNISYITIHSCKSLPVQRVHLVQMDSVLVGWQYNPDIQKRFFGGFSCRYKDVLGVVLAAWDLDKEIEL